MSVDKLLPRFKKKLMQQDLSPVTVHGYLHDVTHFLHWLQTLQGRRRLEIKKITQGDVKAYRQELVNIQRQKAASVNRRMQSLKRFFAWAAQLKLVRKDPAIEVRFMRRMAPTQPAALTKSEVHALLRAAGQSPHGLAKRNYALVQLLLQAGLRVGETAQLQCRDVVLQARSGKARVAQGKGLREREVPLNATARRALSDYLKTRDKIKPKAPLFLTKQTEQPTVRALQLVISNLARRAKITRIKLSAHTLRHTFATNYLQANPNSLVELAALLGHESLNTTAIYTKASKEKLAEGVERTEINIYDD